MELHLNGKFLASGLTGTERYAAEVLTAWAVHGTLADRRVTLHVPADATLPPWLPESWTVRRSRLRGLAFEQLSLPLRTRGRFLVSLAGPAPLGKARQLLVMHDASPMRFPRTYTRAFATWYRLLYTTLSRRADAVATVSEFSRGELSRTLRVPRTRFLLAPCGSDHFHRVEAEPLSAQDAATSRPYVVCVGTLARHKNLGPMVEALRNGPVDVLIVGASGRQQVFAAASSTATGDNVHVLGRISDGELAGLYDGAVALVFPSRYEGFGLPVVEAQVRSCPVVSSDAASLPEVAGDAALYFPPDAPEQGVAQVVRLLQDPDLAADMRARGLANAQRFTWRRTAEALAAGVRAAATQRRAAVVPLEGVSRTDAPPRPPHDAEARPGSAAD